MSRLLLTLGAFVALAPLSRAQELIWAHNPSNGHWYGISYSEMTWFDAEAAAVAQGGHLAALNDVPEVAWVQDAFGGYAASNYWIGLNDIASEGSFSWTSAEPVSVTNWAPGEPDDQFGIQDAVELQPSDGWRWHDANALDFASRRPLAEVEDVPRFGWTLPQIQAVGNYPTHVVVARIDGDSIPDLGVLNAIDETVTILRGTGTGEFVPVAIAAAGTWPRSFTVGDFNQDQIVDFAFGTNSWFVVRFGLGTGAFVLGPSFNLGGAPYAIAAADLNGDARDDLVFGLADGTSIKVLLANGSGSFLPAASYPFSGWAAAVTTADLDADGDLDLVVPSQSLDVVRVFLNSGTGAFTIATTFATGDRPGRAAVGDFDGDARLDIAVPSETTGRLHVHAGFGDGQFDGGYAVGSGAGATWAEPLDVDGDGLTDVAVTCYGGVALHKNRGSLLAGELVNAGFGLAGLAVADLDGDARADLAVCNTGTDKVVVLRKLSRDCNDNGTDDPRDIELGASLDCNANGEPDECDLASGATFDCDGNGAIDACEIAVDSSLDLDGDGALDACDSAGAGYCFGDGTAAACPCGSAQNGDPGDGCRNSSGGSGHIAASGNASVALDSVTLRASGLSASTLGLFFQGDQATNGGVGVAFGDGLRCAGQSVVRLVVRAASSGAMSFGHAIANDPDVSAAGQVPASGAPRFYQLWYRDAASFCTSATWNLTNGVRVVWSP